ncbi:MAG: thioesterase family protein [Solirubrobacteraceae bacterium]
MTARADAPPGPVQRTPFAEASKLIARGEGCFHADISPGWTIGGRPNGGYLLALLGRAATSISERKDVLAASAHYLRAPEPGPAQIDACLLRAGRSASQVRVGLRQDDRECVEALFTTSELTRSEGPWWDGGVPLVDPVGWDACVRLPSRAPGGLSVAMMDELDVRLEPASLGFAVGAPSSRGELRGWVGLLDADRFDAISLLVAVDVLPPATFDLGLTGLVATLELTVYVRAVAAPGSVRVHHRAHLVDNELVDESTDVWDRTGRIVAQARQLARVRLG